MTLTNLRLMARAIIPGCKVDVVSNTLLDLVLNEGVKDIVAYTGCLPTNKRFNSVEGQGDALNPYLLSSVLGDYLRMDKGGLWWNQSGSSTMDYKRLNPRTVAWLDDNRPNWRDIDDDAPEDYVIDGDNLVVIPASDETDYHTNAFWAFYIKVPTSMTAASHYPFSGSATELTHLSIFDTAIVYYARWKILPMLAKDYQDNYNLNYNLYKNEREEKFRLYRMRKDISNVAQFQGTKVR